MAFIDPEKLKAAGFTDKIKPRKNCLVVNVAGNPGVGKTTWALTAPKPLFYQATDFGENGIIQHAEGQIIRPEDGDYKLEIPHEYRAFVDRQETDKERRAREGKLANFVHDKFYVPFHKDYKAALETGVRTVVWDTALEIWEMVRLSVYGREATNRSDLQAEANSKMKEMIRMAHVRNINLIMVNRLKNAWESYYDANGNVKWRMIEDKFEMQGFGKAPELVDIDLWLHTNDANEFEIEVRKCRGPKGAEWVGQRIPNMPFVELMSMLVPEVENWEE